MSDKLNHFQEQREFSSADESNNKKEDVLEKHIMGYGTASIVFGALSFFVFPMIFAILGAAFGSMAYRKGEKKKGIIGIILSIIGFITHSISSFI